MAMWNFSKPLNLMLLDLLGLGRRRFAVPSLDLGSRRMSWTRRQLLAQAAKLVLVAAPLGLGLGCRGSASCIDPDLLTTSDASLRASLNFTDHSPIGPEKDCLGCAFFHAVSQDSGDCGRCEIIQGPVNPRGYCVSWSPRVG